MRTLVGFRIFRALLGAVWMGSWAASDVDARTPPPTPPPGSAVIARTTVESTSLASIGFARNRRVLEVEFRSGEIYRYFGVPPGVFEGFQRAESKGRYFTQFIRGKYEFQRLETPAK